MSGDKVTRIGSTVYVRPEEKADPETFPEDEGPDGKWSSGNNTGYVIGDNGKVVGVTSDEITLRTPRRATGKHAARLPLLTEFSGSFSGELTEEGVVLVTKMVQQSDNEALESAARAYMNACGIEPTPDAVAQLTEVFLPCLQIMCSRPWDPNGATWRESGILGAMTDVRKKFMRFWERGWTYRQRHNDSGLDLINFVGFVMRSDPESGWGNWGEPGEPKAITR